MPERRVFVLGAGFSMPAGLPSQASLLRDCLTSKKYSDAGGIRFVEPEVNNSLIDVTEFLENFFPGYPDVSLEDVFTLLDSLRADRGNLWGLEWNDLIRVEVGLKQLFSYDLWRRLLPIEEFKADIYTDFVAYWAFQRLKHGSDSMSVIQLNWDPLLEIATTAAKKVLGCEAIALDYCCYTSGLVETKHTPSIVAKAYGASNLKMQKLHGSITWLSCPSCERLYLVSNDFENTASKLVSRQCPCPACSEAFAKIGIQTPPMLRHMIISPTYLKEIADIHLRMVWHNARLDLMEADRVIFLGYSLPDSDHHIRSLLKRSVSPNAKIDVVLTERDWQDVSASEATWSAYPGHRFRQFFSHHNLKEFDEGVGVYLRDQLDVRPAKNIALAYRMEKRRKARFGSDSAT